MKHTFKILSLFLGCLYFSVYGQPIRQELSETIEKTGGIYYAYPYDHPKHTPAPKGYKACYISHYGRHGSRWLISKEQYTRILKIFDEADKARTLSPLGQEVHLKVKQICQDGAGRAGELSPLGFRQHKEIAERMYRSFPELFRGKKEVNVYSTTVPRCMLSMMSFCDKLKGLNPNIEFSIQADAYTSSYLNPVSKTHSTTLSKEYLEWCHSNDAPWRSELKQFAQKHLHPQRMIASLFSDADYAAKSVDGQALMKGLFHLASDMQNINLNISLYDIFEKEELYNLWQCENYEDYVLRGLYAPNKFYPAYYTSVLLKDILKLSDQAIENGKRIADLRFGHDGTVMSLVGLLELENGDLRTSDPEEVSEHWQTFRISPMAANIQFIFYKKDAFNDILMRILHNEVETHIPVETATFPYYRWKDVRKFYQDKLDKLTDPAIADISKQ